MTKTVLLAEDEPGIIESLRFILGRAGFAVHVVSDGREAVEVARNELPDAVLLDVMLPGLDGYGVLKALRADPVTARLPVAVLTAKGQVEDRETALRSGADAFITKPFANADVVAEIRRLTG